MDGQQAEVGRSDELRIIDLDGALEKLGGDEELLCEAAQLFLDTCDDLFVAVVDASVKDDAEALTRTAHALKGGVRSFCAEEAQDAAFRLEMMGRNHEVDDLRQPLTALRQALDRLRPVMEGLARAHIDDVSVRDFDSVGCTAARD